MDKNDSPPVFEVRERDQGRDRDGISGGLVLRVSEEAGAGQAVGTVRARDPDTLGRVRYQLRAPAHRFVLEPDTGVLKLAEPLDREQRDTYKLVVRATDGIQYTDTTVTIQVRFNLISLFFQLSAFMEYIDCRISKDISIDIKCNCV